MGIAHQRYHLIYSMAIVGGGCTALKVASTVLVKCYRFHSNIDYFLAVISMKMKFGYSVFLGLATLNYKLMNFVNFSCFHGNMTTKMAVFLLFSQIFQISFGKIFYFFCKHDFNRLGEFYLFLK